MELQFFVSAHRLIMVCSFTKFRENILNGFRVMDMFCDGQTVIVTDEQTDNYGKNNMSPPQGGDIIRLYISKNCVHL